jgi:hypothetical protein
MAVSPKTFSDVFWDFIFSSTGFRKHQLEQLRTDAGNSDRDVVETIELNDHTWTDGATLAALRKALQQYIAVLRALKNENATRGARKLKVKSFVDDSRYAAMRQREVQQRVTLQAVVDHFLRVDLSGRSIAELGSEVTTFLRLQELNVGNNRISVLEWWPPNVRLVAAPTNRIHTLRFRQPLTSLLCLTLAGNELEDVGFLSELPALALADISFNRVADLDAAAAVVEGHCSLRELCLFGNPISFLEPYRRRFASPATLLDVFDDQPVTEAEREVQLAADDAPPVDATTIRLKLVLSDIKNIQLAHPPKEDDAAKTGKGKKAAVDKKKGKNAEAEALREGAGSTRRTLSLAGEWCGATITVKDLDALGAEAEEAVVKSGKGGSKKVVVDTPAEGSAAKMKTLFSTEWTVAVHADVANSLSAPIDLTLFATDTPMRSLTTPLDDPPVVATSAVGMLRLDTTPLLLADATDRSTFSVPLTARLEIDAVSAAQREEQQRKLRAQLEVLRKADAEIDQANRDTTPAPTDPVAAEPVAKGKKGVKEKVKAPTMSVAAAAREEESAVRKAEIDEVLQRIAAEEKVTARFLSCTAITIAAQCTVLSGGAGADEVPEAPVPVETAPVAGGAKKKK